MKSTARILSITERFGEDRKQQLTVQLKALRREIKAELLRHIHKGITHAKAEYLEEIRPGLNHFNYKQKAEHTPQTGINSAVSD